MQRLNLLARVKKGKMALEVLIFSSGISLTSDENWLLLNPQPQNQENMICNLLDIVQCEPGEEYCQFNTNVKSSLLTKI